MLFTNFARILSRVGIAVGGILIICPPGLIAQWVRKIHENLDFDDELLGRLNCRVAHSDSMNATMKGEFKEIFKRFGSEEDLRYTRTATYFDSVNDPTDAQHDPTGSSYIVLTSIYSYDRDVASLIKGIAHSRTQLEEEKGSPGTSAQRVVWHRLLRGDPPRRERPPCRPHSAYGRVRQPPDAQDLRDK